MKQRVDGEVTVRLELKPDELVPVIDAIGKNGERVVYAIGVVMVVRAILK